MMYNLYRFAIVGEFVYYAAIITVFILLIYSYIVFWGYNQTLFWSYNIYGEGIFEIAIFLYVIIYTFYKLEKEKKLKLKNKF